MRNSDDIYNRLLQILKDAKQPIAAAVIAAKSGIYDLSYVERMLELLRKDGDVHVEEADVHSGSQKTYCLSEEYNHRLSAAGELGTLARTAETKEFQESELLDLIRGVKAGDTKAQDKLLGLYTARIKQIANAMSRKTILPCEDLVSEGFIGFLLAAKKCDESQIRKFSSYADAYIYGRIKLAIRTAPALRLSDKSYTKLKRMKESEAKLSMQLGRAPTAFEIAADCALSPQQQRELEADDYKTKTTSIDVSSVDGESESEDLGLKCPDHTVEQDRRIDGQRFIEKLRRQIASWTSNEQLVAELRFFSEKELTQKETADELRVSQQRVQQLEKVLREKLAKLPAFEELFELRPTAPKSMRPNQIKGSGARENLIYRMLRILELAHGHCSKAALLGTFQAQIQENDEDVWLLSIEFSGTLDRDDICVWALHENVTKGRVRETFGGTELVITEAGLSWLSEFKKVYGAS